MHHVVIARVGPPEVLALEDAAEAHRFLQARANVGKVLLTTDQ